MIMHVPRPSRAECYRCSDETANFHSSDGTDRPLPGVTLMPPTARSVALHGPVVGASLRSATTERQTAAATSSASSRQAGLTSSIFSSCSNA